MIEISTYVQPDFKNASGKWVKYFNHNGEKHITFSGAVWQYIKQRCDPNGSSWKNHPSYIGCENKFKNFQSFVEWHKNQYGYGKGFEADKDLLFKNNKVYSEETVVFLPHNLNSLIIRKSSCRGDLPIGVTRNLRDGNYKAQCSTGDGKSVYLGYYDEPISAFNSYKKFKENLIKERAEKWKDEIDPRAYQALINYTVEITD